MSSIHSQQISDRYFNDFFKYMVHSGRFAKTKQFIQHGDTSVYSHCVAVAYVSLWFSYRLHLSVSRQSLLMGAFLHDYFLYDWHEKDPSHRLHGFTHPKRALINATADWNLSPRTQNIILRHMFPLTPIPPAYREAWLVCLADKACALAETLHMSEQFFSGIHYPYDIKNPKPW